MGLIVFAALNIVDTWTAAYQLLHPVIMFDQGHLVSSVYITQIGTHHWAIFCRVKSKVLHVIKIQNTGDALLEPVAK